MAMQFKKAERKRSKLRLALTGTSGSGKTYSALLLAKGICPDGKIAFIDTEYGSGALYTDIIEFDSIDLEAPFSPERYMEGITAAAEVGYDCLIIDSMSHQWSGKGGMLDIVNDITKGSRSKNSYFAWGEATPRHNAFIEAILQAPMHIIATMRSKSDYVIEEDAKGKMKPTKVGVAPVQREGLEFEFTTVLDLNAENMASISKDRTRIWGTEPYFRVTEDHGKRLMDWLNGGVAFDVKAAIKDMQSCEDGDCLRDSFAKHWKEVKLTGTAEDKDKLEKAKDKCKAKFEVKPETEAEDK